MQEQQRKQKICKIKKKIVYFVQYSTFLPESKLQIQASLSLLENNKNTKKRYSNSTHAGYEQTAKNNIK